jgi:hypothetical protein
MTFLITTATLGSRIGEDVARVETTAPPCSTFGVVDPFAGSCDGLFSMLRHLPGSERARLRVRAETPAQTNRERIASGAQAIVTAMCW